jgi:nitrate reductase gamma subunit
MFDMFLFVAMPYLALISIIGGSILRYKLKPFSYTSLSTQFLEDRWLAWASMPWHIGIGVILLGHLVAFSLPGLWSALIANPVFLITVEAIGVLCSILCIIGLVILLIRRFIDAKLQAVTSHLDVLALLILLFQVSTGLSVALLHRWGAAWAPGALGPYLHGIFTFRPEATYMTEMPPFVKLHVASAWFLLLIFPFTRLVHALAIPLHYFFRSPQRVVWNNTRAQARFEKEIQMDTERRVFLKAAVGAAASVTLLSIGTFDKFLRYFLKQDLSATEQSHLLSKKLQRLKQSAEERELELERMTNDSIFIAQMSELSASRGKYFIDYEMRPALAFKDAQGLPIVLSAKCTHLGCTVGQEVDSQGRVLCPCHISYFDIKTGQPNAGSPAKAPLPRLGWALKDFQGNLLLTQDENGKQEGHLLPEQLATSQLFIIKRFS